VVGEEAYRNRMNSMAVKENLLIEIKKLMILLANLCKAVLLT